MSKTGKNLIIVLGIVTVVFAGYYFFIQEASLVLRSTESDQQLQQMLNRTNQFVEHRRILDSINLDTTMLSASEFRSLRSFSADPSEFGVGRENPFANVSPERPVSTNQQSVNTTSSSVTQEVTTEE